MLIVVGQGERFNVKSTRMYNGIPRLLTARVFTFTLSLPSFVLQPTPMGSHVKIEDATVHHEDGAYLSPEADNLDVGVDNIFRGESGIWSREIRSTEWNLSYNTRSQCVTQLAKLSIDQFGGPLSWPCDRAK